MNISPKVIAPAIFNIILIGVVAAIAGITPDLLTFLGPWAGVAYLGIAAIGTALAGYIKRDPARDLTYADTFNDGAGELPVQGE